VSAGAQAGVHPAALDQSHEHMSYGPDYRALFRRAAVLVDKIIKGAKAGDISIEQPTTFDLVINLKTANTIGLDVPPALLMLANKVIE